MDSIGFAVLVTAIVAGGVTVLIIASSWRNGAPITARIVMVALAVMLAAGTTAALVPGSLDVAILFAIVGISGAIFLVMRQRTAAHPAERPGYWLAFGVIVLVATILGTVASR